MIKQPPVFRGERAEKFCTALWKISKPISTIFDGLTPICAEAWFPIVRIDSMIALAMDGPFLSNHKKKPLKVRKRNISPKNSAIEERRKINGMNCHTMLIPTRYINSVVAWA